MKRLRRRTLISILLAMVLAVGVAFFCIKLVRNGDDWVGFFGTKYYSSAPSSTTARPRPTPKTPRRASPPSIWWATRILARPCALSWPAA